MPDLDVAIVGAGLAGLACARRLTDRGRAVRVYESDSSVGGRICTDKEDDFLLDHGFQVLLTAYPEAQRVLDYDRLDLRAFAPGALIRVAEGFVHLGDPTRSLGDLPGTLLAPVGSLGDKLKVLRLRATVRRGAPEALWARPEVPTAEALRDRYGFSERIIARFFGPFFRGIFLEPDLRTSSRAFEYYFRMFSEGQAAVPALGMQRLPEQLADALPAGVLHLNRRVMGVERGRLTLDEGEAVAARAVVVATEAPEAASLLPGFKAPGSRSVVNIYWAADAPPIAEPLLILNGEGEGPVNNVAVMSNVSPAYAPDGQALLSASILGNPVQADSEVEAGARRQMRRWFGPEVDGWRLLRVQRLLHALPDLDSLEPPERSFRHAEGLYVTGDHRRNGSINGALVAGRHAADAVLADLG